MAVCFRLIGNQRLDKNDIAVRCLVGKPSTRTCRKLYQTTAITSPCARYHFPKSRGHIRIFVSISLTKHTFALRIMKKRVKLSQRFLEHMFWDPNCLNLLLMAIKKSTHDQSRKSKGDVSNLNFAASHLCKPYTVLCWSVLHLYYTESPKTSIVTWKQCKLFELCN